MQALCWYLLLFSGHVVQSFQTMQPRRNNLLHRTHATPSLETSNTSPKVQFVDAVATSLLTKPQDFVKIVLSDRKTISSTDQASSPLDNLKSVTARLVEIKAGTRIQLQYRYTDNDQVKNHPLDEASGKISELIDQGGFKKAVLTTKEAVSELNLKRGSGKYRELKPSTSLSDNIIGSTSHDRKKNVPIDSSSPFLRALKITTDGGRPVTGKADKLRQIQKFVEILEQLIDRSGIVDKEAAEKDDVKVPLRVVDMGSGLAYLTFAVHEHFSNRFLLDTIGVEARSALVEQTNEVARSLSVTSQSWWSRLRFVQGNIAAYPTLDLNSNNSNNLAGVSESEAAWRSVTKQHPRQPNNDMDVLIALHACDTATDDAIWCGIQSGARVIVTAPCCHKQLRPQIDKRFATDSGKIDVNDGTYDGALRALLQHGIYRERESEMVTDTLRALALEAAGYDTQVWYALNSYESISLLMGVARGDSSEGGVIVVGNNSRLGDS